MRGLFFRTEDDTALSDNDLIALADALAVTVHNLVGQHVFWLTRQDIAELIEPYIADLDQEDQAAMPWMVWHLIQAARDIAAGARR